MPQTGSAPPAPEELEALQEIVRARAAAMADRTALANQRLASETAFLKGETGRRLMALAKHIDRLDAEIARRLEADPALKRRYDILISIPGAGPVAAIALVAGLPKLGACRGKAASLLAGLAPLACESGAASANAASRAGAGKCAQASTSRQSPPRNSTRNSP